MGLYINAKNTHTRKYIICTHIFMYKPVVDIREKHALSITFYPIESLSLSFDCVVCLCND